MIKEGVESYYKLAESIFPIDVCAYSDASSEDHGLSPSGYALQRGGTTFEKNQEILPVSEVYDAELLGAVEALYASLSARRNNEKIYILLDNSVAVRALQTGMSSSSLRLTRVFHEVAQRLNVEVRWVPGHLKVIGNEDADYCCMHSSTCTSSSPLATNHYYSCVSSPSRATASIRISRRMVVLNTSK